MSNKKRGNIATAVEQRSSLIQKCSFVIVKLSSYVRIVNVMREVYFCISMETRLTTLINQFLIAYEGIEMQYVILQIEYLRFVKTYCYKNLIGYIRIGKKYCIF